MPSTLLAVDDSVTMRKVLEITFAGQDFRVVTVNSADAAQQKLKSEKPDVVIVDLTLEPRNGYELCKALKQLSPGTPVLLLSSKQNPFDVAKGSAAQADDHMDKPFDTQQLIDKVKKLLAAPVKAAPAGAQLQPRAAEPAPAAATAPSAARPVAPAATTAAAGVPVRAKTLIYNPPAPEAARSTKTVPGGANPPPPAPTPATGQPLLARQPPVTAPAPRTEPSASASRAPSAAAFSATPAPVAAPTPVAPAPAPAVTAQLNGQMAGKLEALGLTAAQVDAVLALSREVVERVVWEVVPVLAETLIKEELSRLTK